MRSLAANTASMSPVALEQARHRGGAGVLAVVALLDEVGVEVLAHLLAEADEPEPPAGRVVRAGDHRDAAVTLVDAGTASSSRAEPTSSTDTVGTCCV